MDTHGKDGGMTVIDTPEGIAAYRLLALYHRCELEARGIRFRVNTCPVVRREFGIKAKTKRGLVEEFGNILRERGVLNGEDEGRCE